MSLPRKDVRLKLDADMHEALTIVCEIDNSNIDRWVERVVCDAIRRRVHSANVLAKRAESLRISGKAGETNSDWSELPP